MSSADKYTVLIVDDDEDILDVMSVCLEDHPYNVIKAHTSDEALKALKEHEIAVLLCDLNMSDESMDGNEILARARTSNPDIVSVLMSGQMDRKAMMTALNRGGVSRYLEKPIDLDEVRQVVEEGITRYIRNSRPQDRLRVLASQDTVKLDDPTSDTSRTPIQVIRKPVRTLQETRMIGERYKLMGIVGQGSTGTVYRAQDTFLHMVVALKVLHLHLVDSEQEIAVLKEEARIAMTLSHRNIVRLHTCDQVDEQYFLVMEYVEGCSFRDVLQQDGALPLNSVSLAMRSCTSALAYAHEHGVVHQDLKPENLLLSDNGMVKIIDFGLACLIGKQRDEDHIAGTPFYMSPEQKRGERVDTSTDIYSMGIIAYELLTGKLPFPEGLSPQDALQTDPSELTGVSVSVRPILEKAIHPDPRARWSSIREFCDAFTEEV